MTKLSGLMAGISLCVALIGCGRPGPDAPWIYTEWTEVRSGERVQFRRDGTVNWFGEEGTFRLAGKRHPVNIFASTPNRYDGNIKIDIGDEAYSIPYETSMPTTKHTWRCRFGGQDALVMGERANELYLRRSVNFPGAFEPRGMEKIGDRFPGNFYKRIGDTWLVNGEIYANLSADFHNRYSYGDSEIIDSLNHGDRPTARLNLSTQSWETIDPNQWHISQQSQQATISEKNGAKRYRLQGHSPWTPLPKARDVIETAPAYELEALFLPRLVGTTLYQGVEFSRWRDGDSYQETYSINLADQSPIWKLYAHYSPLGANSTAGEDNTILPTVGQDGTLYESRVSGIYKSEHAGGAWTKLPEIDFGFEAYGNFTTSKTRIVPFLNGIALRGDSDNVALYSAETESWSVVDISADDVGVGELYGSNGKLFFVHDGAKSYSNRTLIRRLYEDGTTEDLVQWDEQEWPNKPSIHIVGGEILVSGISIWRVTQ